MEKYSSYQIKTDGFEKVLVGMLHMIQTVPLGIKCRIVLDYDPASSKTTIETFIDKSEERKKKTANDGRQSSKKESMVHSVISCKELKSYLKNHLDSWSKSNRANFSE